MRFTLTFDTDNAAFENEDEISSVIERVSHSLRGWDGNPCHAQSVRDSNGNRVGQWKITGDWA